MCITFFNPQNIEKNCRKIPNKLPYLVFEKCG